MQKRFTGKESVPDTKRGRQINAKINTGIQILITIQYIVAFSLRKPLKNIEFDSVKLQCFSAFCYLIGNPFSFNSLMAFLTTLQSI